MSEEKRLQKAWRLIEQDESNIGADVRAMIELDTSFPHGENYGRFADLMESMASPLGFDCRRVEVPQALWDTGAGDNRGARVNLIAEHSGAAGEPCSLYYHVDTGPAGDGWTFDPFARTESDGRLPGRGAAALTGTPSAQLPDTQAHTRLKLTAGFEYA